MTDLAAAPADAGIRYARVLPASELRDGELIPVEIDGNATVRTPSRAARSREVR